MKTVGYGFIQIPVISYYRNTICLKRRLHHCVSGTAWKLILQNALRITLLCLWGMQNINYNYPKAVDRIFAIYIEMASLALGIIMGIITMFGYWFKNIQLLYPSLFSIPFCFVVDFILKATCYAYLFLYPYITLFGVFSLIELWWRHLTLMYHWVALISFIHTSKDFDDPFEGKRGSGSKDQPPISTVTGSQSVAASDVIVIDSQTSCVLLNVDSDDQTSQQRESPANTTVSNKMNLLKTPSSDELVVKKSAPFIPKILRSSGNARKT